MVWILCMHIYLLGSESDGIASEFSDIVEDLINRIPYIQVTISTLLPRFDLEEQVRYLYLRGVKHGCTLYML